MKLFFIVSSLFFFSVSISCNKGLLKKSPSGNSTAPHTLTDCLGLLNDKHLMGETPALTEQSADNFYLLAERYNKLPLTEKNAYTWEKNIYQGQTGIPDYNVPYRQAYACNLVLETLNKIDPVSGTQQTRNELRGSALFMRSHALWQIAQLFASVYDAPAADTQPGIILPLTSDQNIIYTRSTMKESYEQIINDLLQAATLLPLSSPAGNRNLPGRTAVFALLARIHLSMRSYNEALLYADSCLQFHNTLIDFNTIDINERHPIPTFSAEVIYDSWLMSSNSFLHARLIKDCIVDSNLYGLYNTNDLRRDVYFMSNNTGKPIIRSSLSGTYLLFSGLATGEILLIQAECNARLNNIAAAREDMRKLLLERYVWDSPIPVIPDSQDELIDFVLTERRKELVFRGLRWTDLRRLNKEGAGIRLHRNINGTRYELPPNDIKYVLPLPDDALIGGNVIQNPR